MIILAYFLTDFSLHVNILNTHMHKTSKFQPKEKKRADLCDYHKTGRGLVASHVWL